MTVLLLLAVIVLVPAVAAYFSETSPLSPSMIAPAFTVGARIIYRREKMSARPGSNACDIRPSAHGEFYYYSLVDYLRVIEVLGDGRAIAIARDNKRICFWPNDSQFRKARLRERFIHRWRFPQDCLAEY